MPRTATLERKIGHSAQSMPRSIVPGSIGTLGEAPPSASPMAPIAKPSACRCTNGAPIVVEAINLGKVIVSGSDVWGDWRRESEGIYTRDWPYNWGVASVPWSGDVDVPVIVRRHELVAVNGKLLRQILSRSELVAGTFHVDEGANRISFRPPNGVDLGQARVEVGMREQLLRIQGGNNVTIRGLVFQHSTEVLDQAAVIFQNIEHILIEHCTFQWNNAVGLMLFTSRDVTVRDSSASHNGFDGMAGYKLRDLVLEDNVTAHNNWRGVWGEFYYWATGQKFMSVPGAIVRRHQSYANQSRGFWFDTDNTDVLVEDSSFHDNRRDGLFSEANVGPATVQESLFALGCAWGTCPMICCTASGRPMCSI
jgi:hypothetical protein